MKPYELAIEEVEQRFDTHRERGISLTEASKRLEQYGPNSLPEEKVITPLGVFLHQFTSPLMFILCIAALASLLVAAWGDAIVIAVAGLANSVVGFIQEWKAEKASEALRSYEVYYATVRREGSLHSIKSCCLVPGDVVLLSGGIRVPADVRLMHAIDCHIDEALLTGESKPVVKTTEPLSGSLTSGDQTNMAFMGTFVLSGKAEGIVVATGQNTVLGDIALLASKEVGSLTPIQRQMKRLSWFLGGVMLAVSAIIFLIGLFRMIPLREIILVSIALAVAAIPEGLLVAVTVVLAIGMQRMLKRKALVKKLVAAEALGSVSVICTDKTGTLTEGHISVVRLVTPVHDCTLPGRVPDEAYDALVMAALNNDAAIDGDQVIGLPTEIALLNAAIKTQVNVDEKRKKFPRINEIPFTSARKFMATVHPGVGYERLIVKGAPEIIFGMCALSPQDEQRLQQAASNMTEGGLRVLALAYKDAKNIDIDQDRQGMNFSALFGMHDPLRMEAAETVATLQTAGIRTVVITGDHADTAASIAQGAGILTSKQRIITGKELDEISDEALCEQANDIDVYARVDPRHKVRIVKVLQAQKRFVAMIGDGVNDAPAIRAADIGVALGSGSDVSQEIADMVLLDNNLATIASAVREGRIIFDNIRKILVYLLTDSFSEVVLIGGTILLNLPLPMHAVQILWINLVSDGLPYLALTVEPGEPEIMQEPPRLAQESIVNREMKVIIFIIGIVTDLGLFGLYLYLYYHAFPLSHLRTIIFTALSIDSLLYVFSVRSMRTSLFRMNPFSNRWMLPAVIVSFFMQLAVVYIPSLQKLFYTVPLNLTDWSIILPLSLMKIFAIEITKEWFIVRRKKLSPSL